MCGPGDRLPGIPANMVKLGADYQATADWTVSLAARYADGQYLRGDESNLNPKTRPYVVLDLASRYRVTDNIELFGEIDNLLDQKYETFGAFSPTADVPIAEVPGATNPRSLSPRATDLGVCGSQGVALRLQLEKLAVERLPRLVAPVMSIT